MYRLDPLVHHIALVHRNVNVQQTVGARRARKRDLLVVGDHYVLRQVVRRDRHHIADGALNAKTVRHQQLRLLLENARQTEKEKSPHTKRQSGLGGGNTL